MMRALTLSSAAQEFGGTLMYPDCGFTSISTDTRKLADDELFVALRGERFDAHEFLPEVATRACGLVVEKPMRDINVPQWVVPDTTIALGQLARLNRRQFFGPVVAITGSSGKTTVKEMIAAILRQCGPVLATKGNLNNQIGVPLTLLQLQPAHRYAVIEMGASGPGEIAYLCSLAKPDVVLVNNVMPAHVAGFGSIAGVARAKGEIYQGVVPEGTAVINLDESWCEGWRNSAAAPVLTYSLSSDNADFRARDLHCDALGCFSFTLLAPVGDVSVTLPTAGRHNVANALAAAACAYAAGADLNDIAKGLATLQPVSGRLNRKVLSNGVVVIDDTYNANPGSVKAAIDVLAAQPGKHVLVLGDMGELGSDEAKMHAEVGDYAARQGVDQLLAVGPLGIHTVKAFGDRGQHFDGKDALVSALRELLDPDMTVLVKGSRFMAMETVVQQITEFGES